MIGIFINPVILCVLLYLVVQLVLAGYLLMRFCYVTLKQTIVVLVAFLACQVALLFAVAALLA